jgi:hypothetical protein
MKRVCEGDLNVDGRVIQNKSWRDKKRDKR